MINAFALASQSPYRLTDEEADKIINEINNHKGASCQTQTIPHK